MKLVTLYGPKGERVVEPSLLDYARAVDDQRLLPVIEALVEKNQWLDKALVSRLFDHRGRPIFSEEP